MYIVLTEWHDENPNDWVALKQGSTPPVLIDRDKSLVTLNLRLNGRNDVVYARAWGAHISKDYPIGEQDGRE